MRSPVLVITVVVLAWFPWSLQARDVFVVTARTTDGTNIVRTAGDSNFSISWKGRWSLTASLRTLRQRRGRRARLCRGSERHHV